MHPTDRYWTALPPLQVRKAYAEKRQVDERSFQLLHASTRIADQNTPAEVRDWMGCA